MHAIANEARIRSQVSAMISAALRLSARKFDTLSIREMFVLCQQHGYELELTVDAPAEARPSEVLYSVEFKI